MTSTSLSSGDIFVCSFPFTSGRSSKPRSVLVLIDLDADCLICRITSKPYSGNLDISVRQWREAGLERPSVIRLTRLLTAEKSLLKLRIGALAGEDLQSVKDAWNAHMRL